MFAVRLTSSGGPIGSHWFDPSSNDCSNSCSTFSSTSAFSSASSSTSNSLSSIITSSTSAPSISSSASLSSIANNSENSTTSLPHSDSIQLLSAVNKQPINRIKRPMNSFMVWSQIRRRRILAEQPDLHNAEISKQLGQEWRSLTLEQRQPFVEEAIRLRTLHQQQHPDYKFMPRKKLKKPRQQQQQQQLPQSQPQQPHV